MIIHNIKITNFKSIYGTQEFNFDDLKGLVKLSGPIGSGKTTIAEAIIYGLYGNIKKQTNPSLIAWNQLACEIEMNITSKNKEIYIKRNIREPLIVKVNGRTISASNKRDTQSILEDELLDVPRLAVERMCIISFNNFNSLASMSPGETKVFLDDVFGFRTFSDYNNQVIIERKDDINESTKLKAIYEDEINQIKHLEQKKIEQQQQLQTSIDITGLSDERAKLVKDGLSYKKDKELKKQERDEKISNVRKEIEEYTTKMSEVATLGRQEKKFYDKFKDGICPTCGQKIDNNHIEEHKSKMLEYASQYKEFDKHKKQLEENIKIITDDYQPKLEKFDNSMNELKKQINDIDSRIKIYNNNMRVINENYDDLITEYKNKAIEIKKKIDAYDLDIGEWNDMNELFSKTLRYNMLETLIPHINKSIAFFINKLEQQFRITFDQEFKGHIMVNGFDKEISYASLSTGQKKTLDLAIIFGILHNIIANVDMNILILDELFSNMDANARNIMLELLNEAIDKDKTIFVINHAEMQDDYFAHKIRVHLEQKSIESDIKNVGTVIVKASKYEKMF